MAERCLDCIQKGPDNWIPTWVTDNRDPAFLVRKENQQLKQNEWSEFSKGLHLYELLVNLLLHSKIFDRFEGVPAVDSLNLKLNEGKVVSPSEMNFKIAYIGSTFRHVPFLPSNFSIHSFRRYTKRYSHSQWASFKFFGSHTISIERPWAYGRPSQPYFPSNIRHNWR